MIPFFSWSVCVNPGGLHGFNEGCPLDCRKTFLCHFYFTPINLFSLSSSIFTSSYISGVFLFVEQVDVSTLAS